MSGVPSGALWRLYHESKQDRSEWRARLRTACLALALDLSVDIAAGESEKVPACDYLESIVDFAVEAKMLRESVEDHVGRRDRRLTRMQKALDELRYSASSLVEACNGENV